MVFREGGGDSSFLFTLITNVFFRILYVPIDLNMMRPFKFLILSTFLLNTFGGYSQADSTKDLTNRNYRTIWKAGKDIQQAGQLYNISTGVAVGGSLLGIIMIANDDAEGGAIVTASSGFLASILQIVGNVRLTRGGQQLYLYSEDYRNTISVGEKENSVTHNPVLPSKNKVSTSELLLELSPAYSYRSYNWSNEVIFQSLIGGANLKYTLNNNSVRLGIVTGITGLSPGSPNASSFYSRAGLFELGKTFNQNEFSIGATLSQWGDFNFLNLTYSRYLFENFSLGIDMRYDYESNSSFSDNRWFPSLRCSYSIPLKKIKM